MSDMVGNPEDRLSRVEAKLKYTWIIVLFKIKTNNNDNSL